MTFWRTENAVQLNAMKAAEEYIYLSPSSFSSRFAFSFHTTSSLV